MGGKRTLGRAMAIVHTEIDYLAPSHAGDELVLGTWITDSDYKVSIFPQVSIYFCPERENNGQGKMRFACISLKSGKLSRMPEAFILAHQQGLAGTFCKN